MAVVKFVCRLEVLGSTQSYRTCMSCRRGGSEAASGNVQRLCVTDSGPLFRNRMALEQ